MQNHVHTHYHYGGMADSQFQQIISMLKELQMTDADLQTLLGKIDTTTNATAANVQTIVTVSQTISDEIDAFIASHPAGTTITDAELTQLQASADKLQTVSDASTAQVATLQAIAAKGAPTVPPAPAPVAP